MQNYNIIIIIFILVYCYIPISLFTNTIICSFHSFLPCTLRCNALCTVVQFLALNSCRSACLHGLHFARAQFCFAGFSSFSKSHTNLEAGAIADSCHEHFGGWETFSPTEHNAQRRQQWSFRQQDDTNLHFSWLELHVNVKTMLRPSRQILNALPTIRARFNSRIFVICSK